MEESTNFSELFMSFFNFRNECDTDKGLSFGYSRMVAGYDFLAARARPADLESRQEMLFQETLSRWARIRFEDYGAVRALLINTARALYADGKMSQSGLGLLRGMRPQQQTRSG